MSDSFAHQSSQSLLEEAFRLHRSGDFNGAEKLYKDIIRQDPRNFDAHFRLGFLYGECDLFEGAQQCMGEAVKIAPSSPDAHFLRGSALLKLGRNAQALDSFDRALALNPAVSEMHLNRAVVLYRLRRYADAEAVYSHLLGIDPNYSYALGNRLMCRLHQCDWRSFDEDLAAIARGLKQNRLVIAPFDAKALPLSEAEELQCARLWAADQMIPTRPPMFAGPPYSHGKIRVAYSAAKFGNDPVSTLLAGVIERHDRSRFDMIGVSLGGDDGSPMHKRLRGAFDRYIDVSPLTDFAVATRLRAMEADIVVDLVGFTEGCRPGIFELRPAPVQVNYLGFAGTMGAGYMDYILADGVVIPAGSERHYNEQVVRLPHCFMPTDDTRTIAERAPSRGEAGLPQTGFVFASFNNSYKFNPAMFDVWMRLLSAVEGSVLWLPTSNDTAMRNLKRAAEARGVAAHRIVFAPFVPAAEEHLARMRLADLFLDTVPYNAHSTASDALWAGVPLLTCREHSFAGRVAASLLQALGLPELVTESLEHYEAKALRLARDPSALAGLKAKLARNSATQPLFDTARFARNLESAFTAMTERASRGEAPSSFAVDGAA